MRTSPWIQVRNSKIHGKGVFAAKRIPKGTRIIEYTGERISWPEALRRVDREGALVWHSSSVEGPRPARVGARLRAAGLQPGDRVLLFMRNHPRYLLNFFRAIRTAWW